MIGTVVIDGLMSVFYCVINTLHNGLTWRNGFTKVVIIGVVVVCARTSDGRRYSSIFDFFLIVSISCGTQGILRTALFLLYALLQIK